MENSNKHTTQFQSEATDMDSDKYAAQKKYHANNRQTMTIAFMKSTEQDLLDYLETVPNKAGYIKQLIREDMKKERSKNA